MPPVKRAPVSLRAVPAPPAPKALPPEEGLRVGREAPQGGARVAPPGKDIVLPIETVTQTMGIVGQKGSGKTHFLTVTFEEMLRLRLPVCVIDPMGVFYGVRTSIDGQRPGFPVLILGGEFGDVPITPGMGRSVAEWLVEERRPVIIDVNEFRRELQCEFVADFCEELFHLNKGQEKGRPLHLIVDEADIFCAQVPSGDAEKRSRDSIDEIVRRGRRRGLGMSMITQRPQVIAKDVLSQCGLFAVLRLVAPQDRDAVMRWMDDGNEFEKSLIKQSLASLPKGTAWLWSPGWLRKCQKVLVRERMTFDSGRTPTVGEEPHGTLCMAELDAGDAAERFVDETPEAGMSMKELRKRVAMLEEILAEHGIEAKPTKKGPKRKKR